MTDALRDQDAPVVDETTRAWRNDQKLDRLLRAVEGAIDELQCETGPDSSQIPAKLAANLGSVVAQIEAERARLVRKWD